MTDEDLELEELPEGEPAPDEPPDDVADLPVRVPDGNAGDPDAPTDEPEDPDAEG